MSPTRENGMQKNETATKGGKVVVNETVTKGGEVAVNEVLTIVQKSDEEGEVRTAGRKGKGSGTSYMSARAFEAACIDVWGDKGWKSAVSTLVDKDYGTICRYHAGTLPVPKWMVELLIALRADRAALLHWQHTRRLY